MATITPFPSVGWSATVQAMAAEARTTYPDLGARLDKAEALVLAGAVESPASAQSSTYTVLSQSDPAGLHTYTVEGRTCTCDDFAKHRTATSTVWCKHIIAVWLLQKTQKQYQQAPLSFTSAASLPEAALSLTLKGTMGGIEAMLTVRGQTVEEFTRNLQGVRGLLDMPTPRESAPSASAADWVCKYHNKALASTKVPGQRYCPAKMADGTRCSETSTK